MFVKNLSHSQESCSFWWDNEMKLLINLVKMVEAVVDYNQVKQVSIAQTTLTVSWEKAIALRWPSVIEVNQDHRLVVAQDCHQAQQAIIALFNGVVFGSQCGLAPLQLLQLTKSYYLSYFHISSLYSSCSSSSSSLLNNQKFL